LPLLVERNCITFRPNFVKIGPLAKKLKGGQTQRAWWSYEPFYRLSRKEFRL